MAVPADARPDSHARGPVYCLVESSALAPTHVLAERLGVHGVRLVSERRRGERRRADRRRSVPAGDGRRHVRNRDGRRIAERRARLIPITLPVSPEILPRGIQLRFARAVRPSRDAADSQRSLRLVTRFQGGDTDALSRLLELWSPPLLAYFERRLRDRHEAEDCVQHVAERLMLALAAYEIRPETPFQRWLFRIARNHLIDVVRQRRGLLVLDPATIVRHRERESAVPEPAIDTPVSGWLARLPARQRQVLTLRFLGDLTMREVGEALGITERAAIQAQLRGLRSLRARHVEGTS